MEIIVDGYIYQGQTFGGISRIFDNILPRLCELDPGVTIQIFNNWDLVKQVPQHKNITKLVLNKWDPYFRPWRLWRKAYPTIHNLYLRSLLGNTKEKIWFSSYYTVPPFEWKGRQIVLAHDFIHEMSASLISNGTKMICQKKESILKADAVICNSQTTAQDIIKYYPIPRSKIFVAKLGYDKTFKTRTLTEIDQKLDFPFILYVGKRNYYKGFDTLLKAFGKWERNREIKLVVVGPSWSTYEEDLIKKNNLYDLIVVKSGINDNQLCNLYNQAEAFIYPSMYEGFGIPLLEAMACSCPIVASQIPSTSEVANNIPYYFDPGDPAGLVNALDSAVTAGRECAQVQQGLLEVNQYSWDEMARGILGVLRKVSENN